MLAAARRASCLRGLAGGLSASGSIFLDFIVEEGSSSQVRPRELEPIRCTRAAAACLCERADGQPARAHLARFCSRPQELQGRLTKAIFECVLLAGSLFRRDGARARVGLRRELG